jgi:hypothetical protein
MEVCSWSSGDVSTKTSLCALTSKNPIRVGVIFFIFVNPLVHEFSLKLVRTTMFSRFKSPDSGYT